MTLATTSFVVKPGTSPERLDFYARLDKKSTAPLWEVLNNLVMPEPRPATVPALWKYDELRPLIMEGGRLITAKEAERRVLVLENPGLRGMSQITQSLYAGLQLILPGETAPTHRHAASALRFIVEGTGAYTAVDGERTTMRPGDFILTPSWTFHDHGNPGDEPVVWLDGLDCRSSTCSTPASRSTTRRRRSRTAGARATRCCATARTCCRSNTSRRASPRRCSCIRTRAAARRWSSCTATVRSHPCHGTKLQYVNPATGGYPMPTIAAFLQYLPKGFNGEAYRGTDATIYSVVEGRGESRIGNETFAWGPRDIFVIPSWVPVSHQAGEEAVLFSFSDRAAQKALGLWREQAPLA